MPCGFLQEEKVPGEPILLWGCHQKPQELYDSFGSTGEKYETRGKQRESLDQFIRCTKEHIGIWCLLYGQEHKEKRTQAMLTLERLREAHPDLVTLPAIVGP